MSVLLAFACRGAAKGHFGMLRLKNWPSNWVKLLTNMHKSTKKWMKSEPKWLQERLDEEWLCMGHGAVAMGGRNGCIQRMLQECPELVKNQDHLGHAAFEVPMDNVATS